VIWRRETRHSHWVKFERFCWNWIIIFHDIDIFYFKMKKIGEFEFFLFEFFHREQWMILEKFPTNPLATIFYNKPKFLRTELLARPREKKSILLFYPRKCLKKKSKKPENREICLPIINTEWRRFFFEWVIFFLQMTRVSS